MVDREQIYERLPVPLQHLACSLSGWQTKRSRFDAEFRRLLTESRARTSWSNAQFAELRDRQVQAFCQRAAASTPFYRRRFAEAGIDPRDIRGIEDLAALPVLTKLEIQANHADLVARDIPARQIQNQGTGGTTGNALMFPATKESVKRQWATWQRYWLWHGIDTSAWCGYFVGINIASLRQQRGPFWRYNWPRHQIIFSIYHMSPDNMPAYAAELRRRQPPWLHGYPSMLALLAAYLIDSNDDLGYRVRWLTTGSENLLPQQVELMEAAFGLRPIQHYGMAEGVANISQCENGKLHVDEDFAAVEFLPVDEDDESDCYRVIGTNVSNPAFPLIRYDVMDNVMITPGEACDCGKPGRIVSAIDGRRDAYLILPSGARLGRLTHIFDGLHNIKESQFHQRRPEIVEIRVVRNASYSDEDDRALEAAVRRRVGPDMDIVIVHVAKLERSARGKLRLVVSEIPEAKIERAGR